jgi:hypothetical protein
LAVGATFLNGTPIFREECGVSGDLPLTGVTVALKNGWLPHRNAPWVVNSIGIV